MEDHLPSVKFSLFALPEYMPLTGFDPKNKQIIKARIGIIAKSGRRAYGLHT
jgi:hypothetical protein